MEYKRPEQPMPFSTRVDRVARGARPLWRFSELKIEPSKNKQSTYRFNRLVNLTP